MIAELDDRDRLLLAGRMGVHALGTPGTRGVGLVSRHGREPNRASTRPKSL
ncbi:hypothetical protein ACFY0A_42930 [Streptomyces sp. NPDC001698]|uniref:hypothetical protein n=1 Tax=unclassified Streptomyces TaxID=2593676 RepID=UPI00369D259F